MYVHKEKTTTTNDMIIKKCTQYLFSLHTPAQENHILHDSSVVWCSAHLQISFNSRTSYKSRLFYSFLHIIPENKFTLQIYLVYKFNYTYIIMKYVLSLLIYLFIFFFHFFLVVLMS